MVTDISMSFTTDSLQHLQEIHDDGSTEKFLTDLKDKGVDDLGNVDSIESIGVSIAIGLESTSEVRSQQGRISITKIDKCQYKGDIYADKKHGKGILYWPDGRIYKGAFFADKRHGFGTLETSDLVEFKGLYRYDERFGPGVLIYKSTKSADVGFWLSENLVRLLYVHQRLNFEIYITDKKSNNGSLFMIPSWYSPQELLTNSFDLDSTLKKKSSALFCKNVDDEKSSLSRYLKAHSVGLEDIVREKRAQLDAYLASLANSDVSKENMLNERPAEISPPNETYEQRQLYYYTNQFWPLKSRATFPIDEVLSNTRSSFPSPGPLENSSLLLFESAYNGHAKFVRDLLTQHQVYVDVCDSRGLTALHFATYNVHIDVVNLLLDFGANVNQISDDGLTSLTIAALLYYGNDPQDTINTAFEHIDPIVMTAKATSVADTRRSSSRDKIVQQSRATTNASRTLVSRASTIREGKVASSFGSTRNNDTEKKISYGYELTDTLGERIRDEHLRESICTLIKLLLRRGADPSLGDWPLPVLALAVRAGDSEMVRLLLKKKAPVNCRLSAIRHAFLTPLHIACGCLTSNAVDIARQLLEHGAEVNAETLTGGREYLTLADQSALDVNKANDALVHGRTPLHIACTREATHDTLQLVRLLLDYRADPNIVCNGQTPLTLAIIAGNEPLVNLLISHGTTDPSMLLGVGNGNALCTVLSTAQEYRWSYAKRLELIERLISKNPKVLFPVQFGSRNSFGSSVDYAYYSYLADLRISQTPFHSLSPQERIVLKERKDLLAYIAKRFREEAMKYEGFLRLSTPIPESRTRTPSEAVFAQRTVSRSRSFITEKSNDMNSRATCEFRFCATCGRSNGVRLTLCKRCQKVYFCSKPCKLSAWNTFHRTECQALYDSSIAERPITTTKTMSSRNKMLSVRPSTHQTELTQFQSIVTSGTRAETLTGLDDALFKKSVLSIKTPQYLMNDSQLPTLSVAKLIRQKRLKKMGRSGENFPPTLPASLEGSHLSWNHMYNAPENYSFN